MTFTPIIQLMVPISKVLPDWMNGVVEAENLKAKLK
jgi:hypothetical protein